MAATRPHDSPSCLLRRVRRRLPIRVAGRLPRRLPRRLAHFATSLLVAPLLAAACGDLRSGAGRSSDRNGAPPDSLPALALDSLPFRYPPALYIERVQDDVTLRLYVDEFGRPVPESTRVEEHAKHAAFDTSAMVGSRDLVFRPAYRDGKPIPYSVLFPIKYRVPGGPPYPADSTPPPGGGRGQ